MLTCQKPLFRLPADLHYLNCAYMAPMAIAVEEAGIRGIQAKRDPSAVWPDDFFRDGERLRQTFARVVGLAEPDRVALLPSVSYGTATAARNLRPGRGRRIVVVHEQFPSNVYTWQRLAEESGAKLVTVLPEDGPDRTRRWNERLLSAIDTETDIVAVPHVHWADGTVFDLVSIGERARDVGAALIVDGTQSVGAFPFDAERIRPDALICAGYKWLMGPYSLGFGWYGPRFDEGVPLEENWISRRDSSDFARLVAYRSEYGPGSVRYDVGERSNFILVPMALAALEMLSAWTVEGVRNYTAALTAGPVEALRALDYGIAATGTRAPHLFGIRLPAGLSVERVRAALSASRISASVRGDAIRIAPNVYNNEDDLSALVTTLTALRNAKLTTAT